VETEQTFEKAARNWHDSKMRAATLKAYRISICIVFLFCNIQTQT